MSHTLDINPWLSVWTRPRDTIAKIIAFNVTHRFHLFCFLIGFVAGLPLVAPTGNLLYLVVMLLVAWPVGYLSLSINSCMFYFTGKLIKGQAAFKEIRSAICWASLPSIIFVNPLYAIMMYLVGANIITSTGMIIMSLPIVIFSIWGMVLSLKIVSQVQRFSIWKALLNLILVILFTTAIMLLILLPIMHGLSEGGLRW